MEEDIRKKLNEIEDYIDFANFNLSEANHTLANLWDSLENKSNTTIKDIDNLKRELRRDGLYSEKLEQFLEDYMKYYNK